MKFDKLSIPDIKKPKRPVFRVFLHCSASDNPKHDSPQMMEAWHRQRGFKEIGYHFFISKDGTLWEGRDLEKIPAAQAGHNANTIAVCVHGLKKEAFTKDSLTTLKALCIHLNQIYNGAVTFHGHREVAPKDCPVFDYVTLLGLDKHGRM